MKKALDMLGETHLPDDLFTDTDGLNGLLDTYPDLGKGLGVLDHDVFGESSQPPNLPDGVVVAEDDDFLLQDDQMMWGGLGDLGDVTKEASLADLSWLEVSEQDPERLPENPVDKGIEELEQAWGVDRRTDGVQVLPNVDREASVYEASLQREGRGAPAQDVASLVRAASRKMVAGASFRVVATEVAQRLGHDAHLAMSAMTRLKDDAGLIGKVFIRASDYPKCASGEWSDPVRKHAAVTTYVVQKKACSDCVQAQDGSCSIFKKRLVASVPWDAALKRYSPALEATGRKVASGDPKEVLRRAFAQTPKGLSQIGDARPHHLVAADQVGVEAARAAFAEMPAFSTKTVVVSREAAIAQVNKWLSTGALSGVDAKRLASSSASGSSILRAATGIISSSTRGAYSGGQNAGKMGYAADHDTALRELKAAEERADKVAAIIQAEMARREVAASREGKRVLAIERKAASVLREVEKGLQGRALVAHVLRTFEAADRGLAASILDPVFRAKGALEEPKVVVKAYSGLANDTRVAGVSAAQAWSHLKALSPPSAIDIAARQEVVAHQKVLKTLGRWARDGLIPTAVAERLAKSPAKPEDVLRVASALAGRVRVAEYSGSMNDSRVADVSQDAAWEMLKVAEGMAVRAGKAIDVELARRREAAVQEKVQKVITALNRGLRGKSLVDLVRQVVAADDVTEVTSRLSVVASDRKEVRHKVLGTIGKWVKAGLLSAEDADRLASSQADPKELLRVATAIAGRSRIAKYSGIENATGVKEMSREAAWGLLAKAEDNAKQASDSIGVTLDRRRDAAIQERVGRVLSALEKGLRGQAIVDLVRQVVAGDERAEVSRVLDPILQRMGALDEAPRELRAYEGVKYERAPAEAPRVASGPAHGEADRFIRWARQQMSEGVVGRDLDHLLAGRFASSVRTAASSVFQKVRASHEGLAGHLYVDAEAYASREGVTGCEKGALRHRANQVPTVLSMPRCGSCTLRVAKADGVPVCSLYNKILVASASEATGDPKAYAAEMVRLADGTDADRTAAMFSNTYDQNEFNLGEDGDMDSLVLSDAPPNEEVGDVFFGGMEFE